MNHWPSSPKPMGLGDGRGCSDGPMLRILALTTDRAKPAWRVTFRNNPPRTIRRAPVRPILGQLANRTSDVTYGAGRVIPADRFNYLIRIKQCCLIVGRQCCLIVGRQCCLILII